GTTTVTERVLPNPGLALFNIVDTPGTNSLVKKHQEITERFIPRADLVLFVTSIDRPFSESEHQFLTLLSDRWRRKIVFVLTKIDTHAESDVAPRRGVHPGQLQAVLRVRARGVPGGGGDQW
ncbi:MAG: Dynamin family protein, partial [Gammaproteobacteria bacterium]|nr:Dynamin family protein [Gammaproteobacteria bacterium]